MEYFKLPNLWFLWKFHLSMNEKKFPLNQSNDYLKNAAEVQGTSGDQFYMNIIIDEWNIYSNSLEWWIIQHQRRLPKSPVICDVIQVIYLSMLFILLGVNYWQCIIEYLLRILLIIISIFFKAVLKQVRNVFSLGTWVVYGFNFQGCIGFAIFLSTSIIFLKHISYEMFIFNWSFSKSDFWPRANFQACWLGGLQAWFMWSNPHMSTN